MNDSIKSLLDALAVSPENIPLRLMVADLLVQEREYADAATHYQQVLQQEHGHTRARSGLAACYFHQGKFATAQIIYEQMGDALSLPDSVLYIKCLLKEGAMDTAVELYQRIIVMNPGFSDPEIDAQLRAPAGAGRMEEDMEESFGELFLEKPKERFNDVGGMKRVKDEISMKIIQPLRNPDLYKAFGKKIGGGILLYGPPGCGKTFIAKATAGEIDAKFINIGLHDILDMWMGNSEKNIHEIFETARNNTPCVLFFDEVDALGASRSDLRQSSMRHVINQFLSELDGVASDNEGILVLAATNAPWNVDPAFRRPGRFDRILFVEPPDEAARKEILESLLQGKPAGNIDVSKVARKTEQYSGADLKALVDIAVESKLEASMAKGSLLPIETDDLLKAIRSHKPTTLEWFSSARNYALYANESGLYDEILKYLKMKK